MTTSHKDVEISIKGANTTLEHLKILLQISDTEKGLDDKFERLHQSINYNFDLLNKQIVEAKAKITEQIKIQQTQHLPGVTKQLTELRDQILHIESLAKQTKQAQELQLQARNNYLMEQSANVPKEPTKQQLIKQMPAAPKNDPVIDQLNSAKVSKLDPEFGTKIKYINDIANKAIIAVTKGMSSKQLKQFNDAMANDRSNRTTPESRLTTRSRDAITRLLKINVSKLDPYIGVKIKKVKTSIRKAYQEVIKEYKNNIVKRVQFDHELKQDHAKSTHTEKKRSPRR